MCVEKIFLCIYVSMYKIKPVFTSFHTLPPFIGCVYVHTCSVCSHIHSLCVRLTHCESFPLFNKLSSSKNIFTTLFINFHTFLPFSPLCFINSYKSQILFARVFIVFSFCTGTGEINPSFPLLVPETPFPADCCPLILILKV